MGIKNIEQQRGIYMVLGAVLAFVLVGLGALVIGLGYISQSKVELQRVGNLAAMGALSAFAEGEEDVNGNPLTYVQRANSALTKANLVLENNSVLGYSQQFSGIGFAGQNIGGGDLVLGNYYRSAPPAGASPCTSYPCFKENPSPPDQAPAGTSANSLQIVFRNTQFNPLVVPFANFFGYSPVQEVSANSALVERYTVYALDASQSSVANTHLGAVLDAGNDYVLLKKAIVGTPVPAEATLIANNASCQAKGSPNFCAVPKTSLSGSQNLGLPYYRAAVASHNCQSSVIPVTNEQVNWCNLLPNRPTPNPLANPQPTSNPLVHYRDDYVQQTTYASGNSVPILVDSYFETGNYEGAEPLTTFFKSFNSGLRLFNTLDKTGGDKAMLLAFTGQIKGRYPLPSQNSNKAFTADLGPLIQIANSANRGIRFPTYDLMQPWATIAPVRPNYLDINAFTLDSQGGPDGQSNMMLAVETGLQALASEAPAASQKTIVLATDGVSNCALKDGLIPNVHGTGQGNYDCYTGVESSSVAYGYYNRSRSQIADANNPGSLLSRLIDSQVSVVAILSGQHLGLNFKNIEYDGHYLDPREAAARGYSGYNAQSDYYQLFDLSPGLPNPDDANIADPKEEAMFYAGKPGYIFRDPIGVWADVALKSGGVFCPLMPKCAPDPSCGYVNEEVGIPEVAFGSGVPIEVGEGGGGGPIPLPTATRTRTPTPIASATPTTAASPTVAPSSTPTVAPSPTSHIPTATPTRVPASCYEDLDGDPNTPKTLKQSYRAAHPIQTCSLYDLTESEQAAYCVRQALGGSPFMLVAMPTPTPGS